MPTAAEYEYLVRFGEPAAASTWYYLGGHAWPFDLERRHPGEHYGHNTKEFRLHNLGRILETAGLDRGDARQSLVNLSDSLILGYLTAPGSTADPFTLAGSLGQRVGISGYTRYSWATLSPRPATY